MQRILPEVITALLEYHGAVVEKREDNSLEVICPPEISRILGIPEYAPLYFSQKGEFQEGICASYDSDFFNTIENLFAGKRKICSATYVSSLPNTEKISRVITENVPLNNATFRLTKNEVKNISYLLCYFKYTALSDEKHEGILPVLINEMNLSTVIPSEDFIANLKEGDEQDKKIEKDALNKAIRAAYAFGFSAARETLQDFIKSLERRLNRDSKKIHEYYETLKDETHKIIEKHEKTIKDGNVNKFFQKLAAIETEQKWKIHDLLAKYALSLKMEPVSLIRIKTETILFWIEIKRRISSRVFPLAYNPLIKQLDSLPCEVCFNPHPPYFICDDKLHIVCSRCFVDCPRCGKKFCQACYPVCPKCNCDRRRLP